MPPKFTASDFPPGVLSDAEVLGLYKCDAAEQQRVMPGNVNRSTWLKLEKLELVHHPFGDGQLRLTDLGREVLTGIDRVEKAKIELRRKAAVLREAADIVNTYAPTNTTLSEHKIASMVSQLNELAMSVEEL